MGKFTNDMATLVEKVRSSAGARRSSLRATRKDTKSMLGHNRRGRRDMARCLAEKAKALGAKLEQQHRERKQAAGAFYEHLNQMEAARNAALSAARSNTQARLGSFRHERGQRAGELKEALRRGVAGTREAVGVFKSTVRAMMSGIGADVREATHLWRKGLAKTPRR